MPDVEEDPRVVRFVAPHEVDVVAYPRKPLQPDEVRVRTLFSGISAGTELTAYRGSNPYLTKHWDAESRLFDEGETTFEYPLEGWGYSESGLVSEVGSDVTGLTVGDLVYGIWGHRSEGVLPAAALASHVLPPTTDAVSGTFARVGAIALNAVLAARLQLGDTVAIFGQGVIGLLATRLAALSGATVLAVDAIPSRLELASALGAAATFDATQGRVAEQIKALHPHGLDAAIDISGSYRALHEAIRTVSPGARVVASGFYQGDGIGLRLGEEFHHNRVQIIGSQIGGVPTELAERWTRDRLQETVVALLADGRLDVHPLVSHLVPVDQAPSAYRLLDESPSEALQVVLDFRTEEERLR